MTRVCKGTRWVSASRDWFYEDTDGEDYILDQPTPNALGGFYAYIDGTCDSDTSAQTKLPCFGTNFISRGYDAEDRHRLYVNDSAKSRTDMTGEFQASGTRLAADEVLGVHTFQSHGTQGQNHNFNGCEIVTPTHTSSHYQAFETPYLHELVGGDRNMEQNNLIVTADGKSWDEVTRDTSYLGPPRYVWSFSGSHISSASTQTSTSSHPFVCRGKHYGINYVQKNWFPTYSAHFCLVPGVYEISGYSYHAVNWGQWVAELNGTKIIQMVRNAEPDCIQHWKTEVICVRGDRLTLEGGHGLDSNNYARYQIKFLREIG